MILLLVFARLLQRGSEYQNGLSLLSRLHVHGHDGSTTGKPNMQKKQGFAASLTIARIE